MDDLSQFRGVNSGSVAVIYSTWDKPTKNHPKVTLSYACYLALPRMGGHF